MSLQEKYSQIIAMAPGIGAKILSQEEKDGKLYLSALVSSQAEKDKIVEQINSLSGGAMPADLIFDIKVGGNTYTVKSGDTLSGIAKQFYGNANKYMDIFNANKDKLSDPNKIYPGQELIIP
ncbi:MAG: LysM peptidoglycan-binding domain-containing protein [Ignavibacteria bacterium]|nr:LysM peptidoglycan-binding domain-containing protein [Ignavibacteria bacterium]